MISFAEGITSPHMWPRVSRWHQYGMSDYRWDTRHSHCPHGSAGSVREPLLPRTDWRSCTGDVWGCTRDPRVCTKDLRVCTKDLRVCMRDSRLCISDLGVWRDSKGCTRNLGVWRDSEGCTRDLSGCGLGGQSCGNPSHSCNEGYSQWTLTLWGQSNYTLKSFKDRQDRTLHFTVWS